MNRRARTRAQHLADFRRYAYIINKSRCYYFPAATGNDGKIFTDDAVISYTSTVRVSDVVSWRTGWYGRFNPFVAKDAFNMPQTREKRREKHSWTLTKPLYAIRLPTRWINVAHYGFGTFKGPVEISHPPLSTRRYVVCMDRRKRPSIYYRTISYTTIGHSIVITMTDQSNCQQKNYARS